MNRPMMEKHQLGDLWFQPWNLDHMLFVAPAQVEYERFVDREVAYLRVLGEPKGFKEGRYVFRFDYDDRVEDDWFAGWVSVDSTYDLATGVDTVFRVDFLTEPTHVIDFNEWLLKNNDVLSLVSEDIFSSAD